MPSALAKVRHVSHSPKQPLALIARESGGVSCPGLRKDPSDLRQCLPLKYASAVSRGISDVK